jgi:protein-tyrosine phosphatase
VVPIHDGGFGEEEFEAALGEALPFIARRRGVGNVLVHCAAGMSRSVSVVAALLCEEGMAVDRAYESIADAKARALADDDVDTEWVIAPAWEFRSCLQRRFGR